MRTSRRVMLSLACVFLAIATLFLWSIPGYLISRNAQPLGSFLRSSAEILPIYFLFAFPGWLIALPFVIMLKDAENWRGWFILLLGTCIGPGFILAWSLIQSHGQFDWRAQGHGLGLPLLISLPTTVFYVLALKFAHRRSIASAP